MVAIALLSSFGVEAEDELELSGAWKLSLLSELPIGTVGVVESLDLPQEIQHHLMHMGFVPEARVVVVRRAPAGDPTVYSIDGFEVALRRDTAGAIRVRNRRTYELKTGTFGTDNGTAEAVPLQEYGFLQPISIAK